MTEVDSNAHFWESAGKRLARRVNFGWWLTGWMGWCMGAGLGGSIVVLLIRTLSEWDFRWAWGGAGLVLLVGSIVAWIGLRRRAETPAVARVRLEDAFSLRARLSAASAGVGPWPAPLVPMALPVRVRWARPLGVIAFSVIMVWLASFVPVSKLIAKQKRIIEKPAAAQEVARWVDQLRQNKAAAEPSLNEVEKKLNELLQRPAEHWYEQSNLEAASALQETTADSLRDMARNMAAAERASNALAKLGSSLPPGAHEGLAKSLRDSLNALASGDMKPSDDLLQQLQQMGADDLSKLSQEDLEKLAQSLQNAMKALNDALENSPNIHLNEIPGGPPGKEGEDDDPNNPGGSPGKDDGGHNRKTPLTTKREPTDLETNNRQKLDAKPDLSRLAPGDVQKITDGQHHVDKNGYKGPQQSGTVDSLGDGGGAVWQNSLVPEEREALKKYFK